VARIHAQACPRLRLGTVAPALALTLTVGGVQSAPFCRASWPTATSDRQADMKRSPSFRAAHKVFGKTTVVHGLCAALARAGGGADVQEGPGLYRSTGSAWLQGEPAYNSTLT